MKCHTWPQIGIGSGGKICFKGRCWIGQQSWNMDVTFKLFIDVKFLKWKIAVWDNTVFKNIYTEVFKDNNV